MTGLRKNLATASAVPALLVTLAVGCGPSGPAHEPGAQYTPDSLAQELIFRYQALQPSGKTTSGKKAPEKAPELDTKAATKAKEATKEAEVTTLDTLAADIGRKARLIKGTTPADVLGKVEALVKSNSQLADEDKTLIAQSLKAHAN